jgi:electron transfer flavoprotein beta subunit
MAMNVAVCVKQIPDPAEPGRLQPDTHTLDRSEKLMIDDSDRYGVEMALQLVEQAGEGEVVLVSMTPRQEVAGLRTGLAMGAARAVLVSDDALAGSDALGTAKVLAAAIGRVAPDLVIAGTESTDGYTGTTPVQVAELLGWPSVSFARRISVDGAVIRAERQTESGYDEVEVPLPALVTVTAGVVEPRYPNFRGITGAKNKPLEILTVAELGIDPVQVGAGGARQEILAVEPVPARSGGEVVADDGQGHLRIKAFLEELKVVGR